MPADTIPGLLKHLLAKQFKSCGECVEAAHSLLGIYTFTLSWQTRQPLVLLNPGPSLSEAELILDEPSSYLLLDSSYVLDANQTQGVNPAIVVRSAQVQQLPNQAWAWVPDHEDDRALVEYLRLEGWG